MSEPKENNHINLAAIAIATILGTGGTGIFIGV